MFFRLFKTHPNIQDAFPSFKGVSLDELMNSRSLYLHANRVMAVVENAISALDDADEVIDSLTNLGKKHQPWSLTQEHFRVNHFFAVIILFIFTIAHLKTFNSFLNVLAIQENRSFKNNFLESRPLFRCHLIII